MSVAVVQMRPEPGQWAANRDRTVQLVRLAADAGASLVVLPEMCCTEYVELLRDPDRLAAAAEPLDGGPSVAAWMAACRETGVHLVAGLVEQAPEGLYNSAAVVGPDGLVGVYRKAHLFEPEKDRFLPGNTGFPVFDLPCGRVGTLICYDLRFVEAARILGLLGAEIVAVPTTWTDLHKPEPWDERGWCQANYLAVAHAYTNRYYVACADRIGTEAGIRYLGCSAVVSPQGRMLRGPVPPEQEGVWVAPANPAAARQKRLGQSSLWDDRRTDLYDPLLGYHQPPPH